MADDDIKPWTKPVIDNATYDDCYLIWLVRTELLSNSRWRLAICRTINRETLPDLIGAAFDG